MAGGEQDGREGRLGARLSPSDEPPQPLAQEEQPQPSSPQHEEEQEEDGEGEEEPQRSEGRLEGVLDEATAAEGLHDLGYSAPGTEYVYLHLSLPGRELSDISILSGYTHLQKLELSCNKIHDLSCISHMPYLIELRASKNELTTYFDFKPPKNLREVDFSHNQIPKMQNLSAYHSLTKLLLDFNEIEEIRGLEECHRLTQLGLSHNKLTAIGGLDNLPIRILNLSFNRIEEVAGLEGVKTLRKVDLSCNRIHSLRGLEGHDLLEVIDLEDNQVAELSELEWLKDLPLLRFVNLLKNPLQEKEEYWLLAVFKMLQITELDHKKISVEEKVTAVNKWDPPPEVVAARDHRTQVLCNLQQPQRVLHSTLADELYPMLVLLGPLACGKRELSFKICRKFKNSLRFGPCHTTRMPYFGEENRFDYYFVSQEQFDGMVEAGKFLVTYESRGHWYGLARNTVESIAREGLATCVHLEIEGVRSLKKTYFKPKYVLLVPKDKWQYEEHLRRKGLFTRPEIAEAVSRVDMYLQINQEFPEYFDAIIHTDDLEEAFEQLSVLMKLLLGLEPPGAPDSTRGTKSRAGCRARLCSRERLSPGRRTPVSLRPPSRASLQKRFSVACQALFWKDPGAKSQLFHRGLAPEPESSCELFLKPKPPRPSDARNVPQEQSFSQATPERRESLPPRGSVFVQADPALADGLPPPIPCGHHRRPGEAKAEPRAAGKDPEVPGENLQRKCSRSKSGSSPVPQLSQPGSHPKPVLPPIPPGWKITNP